MPRSEFQKEILLLGCQNSSTGVQLIIILLLLVILALVALSGFLFFYYFKVNKKIDLLLEKGKIKGLRNVLFSHIEKTKELDVGLKDAFNKIKSLEDISKISFQKMGVVRFNPFSDMGGNQSFAIALLDNQNNGFVISSFFVSEGNRVYAKSVVAGKSEYTLSGEEKDAIARAIGSGNPKS